MWLQSRTRLSDFNFHLELKEGLQIRNVGHEKAFVHRRHLMGPAGFQPPPHPPLSLLLVNFETEQFETREGISFWIERSIINLTEELGFKGTWFQKQWLRWWCKSREKKNWRMRWWCLFNHKSCVWLSVTPWTAAFQATLSFPTSQSLLKLMYIELVMPPNHLILCCPLLLLPSIFPSITVFSNESALCIRWPKYWSFSISPCNEYSGLEEKVGSNWSKYWWDVW